MLNARPVTSNEIEFEGVWLLSGSLSLVSELVGSREFRCNSGNPVVMVVREICPPLVQMT